MRPRHVALAAAWTVEGFVLLLLLAYLKTYRRARIKPGTPYLLDGVHHPFPASLGSGKEEGGSFPIINHSVARGLKRTLLSFAEVCEAHGVLFWASGGTLLGAMRHGGFVPWDDDMDVHAFRSSLPVVRSEAFLKDLASRCLVASRLLFGRQDLVKVGPPGGFFFLDVFFVDDVGGEWGHCTTSIDKATCSGLEEKERYEMGDLLPLRTVPFEDVTIPVPRNPLAILARQYGEGVMRECKCTHTHSFDMIRIPRVRVMAHGA